MLASRYPIIAGVLTIALLSVMTSGCAIAPDRQQAAQNLEVAIKAMPGVETAMVNYTNGFDSGANLDISVTMTAASTTQIAQTVTNINNVKGQDFADFQQTTDFIIGNELDIKRSGPILDAQQIAHDAQQLRQLAAVIPADSAAQLQISWTRNESRSELDVWNAVQDPQILDAVRATFGGDALDVTLTPQSGDQTITRWDVQFPFSAQQQDVVLGQLGKITKPVSSVTINNGHIAQLSLQVSPETAYQDLTSAIIAINATSQYPLLLSWDAPNPQDPNALKFSGVVDVAGCTYGNDASEQHPELYYTPDAIALQQQLRSKYDTCPK